MTLRADSYSSVADVTSWTRHLLRGQITFSPTTVPTYTDVERFLDRVSGVLNNALLSKGFMPANVKANSTAVLLCDDWVAVQASVYVEMTQRGVGYSNQAGERVGFFSGLYKKAEDFVDENKLGLQRGGVAQSHPLSEGLQFTALGDQADRPDREDTTLEQPLFKRRQFDFPKSGEGIQQGGGNDEGQGDE